VGTPAPLHFLHAPYTTRSCFACRAGRLGEALRVSVLAAKSMAGDREYVTIDATLERRERPSHSGRPVSRCDGGFGKISILLLKSCDSSNLGPHVGGAAPLRFG